MQFDLLNRSYACRQTLDLSRWLGSKCRATILFLCGTTLFGPLGLSAESLSLRDGNTLQGTLVKSDGKTIEWRGELGTLTVDKGKVAAIRFGDAPAPAGAADKDSLALRNGNVATGKFLGSDGRTIRFESALGTLSVKKDNVDSMVFAGTRASDSSSAPSSPTAGDAQVTLPVGTVLLVKMASNVSSKSSSGAPFDTVLTADLTSNGKVVVKAGSKVLGRVKSASEPRGLRGQTTLDIRLEEILLSGQRVKVITSGYRAAGDKGVKQAARGAALGAAIGGIADGGEGAGKGAAAGAAAGTLKKGNTITIPPGTLLEFELMQPATFKVRD